MNILACPTCKRGDGLEREYTEAHYGYQRVRFTMDAGKRTETAEGPIETTRDGSPEPTGSIWCSHCEDDCRENALIQIDPDGNEIQRQPVEQGRIV